MADTARAPPAGYSVHSEQSADILVENVQGSSSAVFLNPIQEFNRDLSITAIHAWSRRFDAEKKAKFDAKQSRRIEQANKKRKIDTADAAPAAETTQEQQPKTFAYRPYKFTLFEGLSATGLRSIRYAKEIPAVRWVQANDFSATAVKNIQANIDWNGLGAPKEIPPEQAEALAAGKALKNPQQNLGKVRVSHGDASAVLYSNRTDQTRFDVVDLDPYGTAAPFIDASVQGVSNGGLLCVTCTDLAVLAGSNYPEKCYANYGGMPARAEYTHEVALRLVLNTIATSAARYGRYMEPLLSLSIDYYLRVFVRLHDGRSQVKELGSHTGIVLVCPYCQIHHAQPFGRTNRKTSSKSEKETVNYSTAMFPPETLNPGAACQHCDSRLHVAGPMWLGPLHDPTFAQEILNVLDEGELKFGTAARIKGMVTVAKDELQEMFYLTPAKLASWFHAESIPLVDFVSAIYNAGFTATRSHACAGSVKTSAPREVVYDIMRKWIETHPVKMENIKAGSPARNLLAKASTTEGIKFDKHPDALAMASRKEKLVRYQANPTANWGPQARAKGKSTKAGANGKGKGKRSSAEMEGQDASDEVPVDVAVVEEAVGSVEGKGEVDA